MIVSTVTDHPPHGHDHSSSSSQLSSPYPREILEEASELLRVLGSPIRIAIVLRLRQSPCCVHELVDALGVTQPLISQHLRILKSAKIVTGERCGREVLYLLTNQHLSHVVLDAIAHVQESHHFKG